MAYCVECGVELAPGVKSCPLCRRKVVAPQEIIGVRKEVLFPSEDHRTTQGVLKMDKYRKGFTELIITFSSIAILTLIITGVAFGNVLSFWQPVVYVILGSGYLLVLLLGEFSYRSIASWYSILTCVTVFIADVTNGMVTWSAYAMIGILLFYMFGVFLFTYKSIPISIRFTVNIITLLISLACFDLFSHRTLTWFLPVALPVVAIAVVSLAIVFVRYVKGSPSITDMVLMLLGAASTSTVAGDFFALRWKGSDLILSWSFSLFIITLILLIFIVITMSIRKVRFYFHNKIV